MKARKQRPDARSSVNPNQVKNTKRYMILTYSVEYDKVHYPLPLNYEVRRWDLEREIDCFCEGKS